MNRLLIKKIYFSLQFFLKEKLFLKKIKQENQLVILNLHRISNEENPFYPSLSPNLFEVLLIYITENFNVLTFDKIPRKINNIKPYLILSFDDGFFDFKTEAIPLLKKYNVNANLNIIPECVKSGVPVWDVLLGDMLNQIPMDIINKINLPNFNTKLNQSNKANYGLTLTRYLKQLKIQERKDLWSVYVSLAEELDVKYTKMLTKSEILEISKTHQIGVHSYSHESMGQESKIFFENDFKKCKQYFRDEIKIPMNVYAFPSGSYKQYQIDYLLANGIGHVLLVNEQYSKNNTKIHNRLTYYADSKSEVKLRALGFHR